MKRKIIAYILLIIWLIIIFYLSHQSGLISGENSEGIIYNTLEFIYNIFSINTSNINKVVELIHIPLREVMHIIEFLILGFFMINVLKNYNLKSYVIISIMLCFIYATTDEVHQAFIPARTFQYLDIFMDLIGITLGSLIGNKIIKPYRN